MFLQKSKKSIFSGSITQPIVVVCCLFFGFSVALAAPDASVLAQFKSPACIFSGDFEQTKTIRGLDKNLNSSGRFFYHCEKGVVWKTTQPIEESLVFTKAGKRWKIQDQKSEPINTRQSRMLGELMNGLIGWQLDYIESNFSFAGTHSNGSDAYVSLLPRKRSLKRALAKVELNLVPAASADDSDELVIAMLDSKAQLTRITVSAITKYSNLSENGDDLISSSETDNTCASIEKFALLECASLEFSASGPENKQP